MARATGPRTDPRLPLRHGGRIPQLGLGTWQLTGRTCRDVIGAALDLGYRHVDTAEDYGNEEEIGRAVAASGVPRDELFLTSKAWRDHLEPDALRSACERSLERLGTDRLDLYLVHWPNPEVDVGRTVEGMEGLREAGLVRAWGVSNFTVTHLREVLDHGAPSVNQVEMHPYLRQSGLQDFCDERKIVVTAYSPLARGETAEEDGLREIGERHGVGGAQVALRWSIQRGRVVIPKSGGREHLEENLAVLDFELDDGEMRRIDRLDRGDRLVEPGFAEFDRDG